ncbi:hypothetical protein FH972_023946 [Carpinus fangiana]|uniref:Uncharacterized protein n=1 Tax=Carpinus fangiana TaxID=176857 RepID=A0A5N6KXF1_9ROSI|nr:hypothetical protein FH972_023946 [Carpinus fangiana]
MTGELATEPKSAAAKAAAIYLGDIMAGPPTTTTNSQPLTRTRSLLRRKARVENHAFGNGQKSATHGIKVQGQVRFQLQHGRTSGWIIVVTAKWQQALAIWW